jgi:hypothetical protein
MLYALPALICVYGACVTDPDVWWHLRSGEWMLAHHAVPRADPFGTGKPWAAYSWLYELLVAGLYGRFGMAGIVAYTAGMMLAIAVALHRLIRGVYADFNASVLLTFAACLAMGRLDTPRPWLFTILCFTLELDILMCARRTGRMRGLALLPVLFTVWANVHIQFVDGLLVLALAAGEALAARWRAPSRTALTQCNRRGDVAMVAAFAASCVATLVNPYGAGIYKVAYELASQTGVAELINELKPIPFRSLPDYCVLLLAVAAVALLARSRRARVFECALLAVAFYLSFHSLRDVWVMAVVASAIIAQELGEATGGRVAIQQVAIREVAIQQEEPHGFRLIGNLLVVPMTVLVLWLGCAMLHVDNTMLRAKLGTELPADAADAVVRGRYAGPVFNTYGWGGYLMWRLREPVAIDGRAALYGTERIDRNLATWNGEPGWDADAELMRAGVVIGPARSPLVQLLRSEAGSAPASQNRDIGIAHPDFVMVYEDSVAAVLVARR